MMRCSFRQSRKAAAIAGVAAAAMGLGGTLWGSAPAGAATMAQEPEVSATATSALSGVRLPPGALRLGSRSLPDDLTGALRSLVASVGPQAKQGRIEVLGWTGSDSRPDIAGLKAKMAQTLRDGGWTYEETVTEEKAKANPHPLTFVTAFQNKPIRRGLMGFWVPGDKTLLLAWTEVLPKEASLSENVAAVPSAPVAASGTLTLMVGPGQENINVMKNALPPLPAFAKVTPKPGTVRGYVKDAKGRPLAGAVIGVRSTAVGGFYSGASAKTDTNGYYEVAVPWGVAEFYAAGYTVDYGEGRAALGLHPADGDTGQFASTRGLVKNWVLLYYGIGDRDTASENPKYSGNYYGGTFTVGYWVADEGEGGSNLPKNSEIEITLTPQDPLLDGTAGRTLVIRQRIEKGSQRGFAVNNVPIGRYRMSARLLNPSGGSQTLHLKETGPYANNPFGLEPKSGDSAILTFRPGGAKAGQALAGHGNWESLDITLSR